MVHGCPHCGSKHLQKNGHTSHGAQRAKCVECARPFTLLPKGPRYDEKFKTQVLSSYQDWMSIRGITRTFGVCYQTVMAWVGGKVAALLVFEDTLLLSRNDDVLELDELWSFVEKKTQERWLWIALCRRTRQIVVYTIEDRSQEGAVGLREHLPANYRRRATRSDF